ncbi:hypothetical protein KFL_002630120 [Klebsormidium nitens]|uniref:ApaG domain-containing protein n=1 Tax=Klebsormidium nitens TaxID=105231 RepID=A0A1Y1ID06_KLENI|nr:hypothetical protein KFL_002630120 [Klebsormidium nitens]|eukprot:GAQ85968.1 hypothetical protein KFL_002630120 [Klebsormidium nitens]
MFSSLNFRDCAAVACVQQAWRVFADEDDIWKGLCQQDYHLTLAEDWNGNQTSSFKKVYESWYLGFGKNQYGHLLPRAKRCWGAILDWTGRHAPAIAATISSGASEEELDHLEEKLGAPLPPAVRVVYRLHNGQWDESLFERDTPEKLEHLFLGLLGGYSFYDRIVCTRLVRAREIAPVRGHANLVRFAESPKRDKYFAVSLVDGEVYTRTFTGHHLPCCPPESQQGGPQAGASKGSADYNQGEGGTKVGDGMLRWLEEYAQRLQEGWYPIKPLWTGDRTRGISLFPETGPAVAEAVTRGVKVRSSAIFVPEHSHIHPLHPVINRYFFAYSIRLSYEPPEEVAGVQPPRSVQLRSRQWIIRENGAVVDEVRGAGVIGKYPLLQPGQPEFFLCPGAFRSLSVRSLMSRWNGFRWRFRTSSSEDDGLQKTFSLSFKGDINVNTSDVRAPSDLPLELIIYPLSLCVQVRTEIDTLDTPYSLNHIRHCTLPASTDLQRQGLNCHHQTLAVNGRT